MLTTIQQFTTFNLTEVESLVKKAQLDSKSSSFQFEKVIDRPELDLSLLYKEQELNPSIHINSC